MIPLVVVFLLDWKMERMFRDSRLHTLEFSGIPSIFFSFSWILEGSLPCLEHLKVRVLSPAEGDAHPPLALEPAALQPPTGFPLRVLDLYNATLPWSPKYLSGLTELHLHFENCLTEVVMTEDELLGILCASPQLERLSLRRIQVGHNPRLPPTRAVLLPRLAYLSLENRPEVMGYILAHVDVSATLSLKITALISPQNVEQAPGLIFPDDHVSKMVFSDPPVFKIGAMGHSMRFNSLLHSLTLRIGGCEVESKSHPSLGTGQNIVTAWSPLVPPSVTTLLVNFSKLDQQQWRDFFQIHQEVHTIECSFDEGNAFESLWDALQPAQEGSRQVVLCPSLESICFKLHSEPHLKSLLSCLRGRKNVGFKLEYLNTDDNDGREAWRMAEDFRPLVGALEIAFTPVKWGDDISIHETAEI